MKINGRKINLSLKDLNHKKQKETIEIKLIDKKSPAYLNLKSGDKKALEYLVKAAKAFNDVALELDNPHNLEQKKALEKAAKSSPHAKAALWLFNSFNGLSGTNGIDKKPIQVFKGLKLLPGRNFYPADLKVKEFHKILEIMLNDGKRLEVQNILSNRTVVRREGKILKAIDYTEYFAKEFKKAAEYLEQAAKTLTNAGFKNYLKLQAKALLKNDNKLDAAADAAWAKLQNTDLEFTLGRENYDDEITPTIFDNKNLLKKLKSHHIEINSKDMLGVRVGIVNPKGTDLILKFKSHMCALASLMPHSEKYEQHCKNDLKQTMVDADIVYLSGDYAQCRGGITTAQNLPNNDKLSVKEGGGRRNVYHRQIRQTQNVEKTKKMLNALVEKDLHQFYNIEADHLFVIGHENGHSLGPNSEYQSSVGIYKHVIEELKADIISLAFMPEYAKTKTISCQDLKEIYLTVAFRLFLAAKPQISKPHRVADLIIFNYLLKNKAISFDKKYKMSVNFETFGNVCYHLLSETIDVQISKSPQAAKKFIDKYAHWGKISRHIASVHKKLGLKPYKEIKSSF